MINFCQTYCVILNRATTGRMSTMLWQFSVLRTIVIAVGTKLLCVSLMTCFLTHCKLCWCCSILHF